MPALAKQPSTRPNASSVAAIAFPTDAGSLTSQMRVSTLPGPFAMLAAAALFFSALRPQIETLQPLDARACAMPRPIPLLPPVTTATRPDRSKMLMGLSVWYDVHQLFKHGQWRCKNQIWRWGPARAQPAIRT